MLLLKACPKCGGDMHVTGDVYGFYASCLNCGYLKDVQPRADVEKRLTREVPLIEREQKQAA